MFNDTPSSSENKNLETVEIIDLCENDVESEIVTPPPAIEILDTSLAKKAFDHREIPDSILLDYARNPYDDPNVVPTSVWNWCEFKCNTQSVKLNTNKCEERWQLVNREACLLRPNKNDNGGFQGGQGQAVINKLEGLMGNLFRIFLWMRQAGRRKKGQFRCNERTRRIQRHCQNIYTCSSNRIFLVYPLRKYLFPTHVSRI